MIVSSDTLPSLLPTRPTLATGGGFWVAPDASLLRTFSNAFLPRLGSN
jgi:hypothetical protein